MTAVIGQQLSLFTGGICPGEGTQTFFGSDAPRERMATKAEGAKERGLHEHSLAARENNEAELHGRKALILDCLRIRNRPLTDRQILEDLYPGSDDMNRVRPRITELIRERRLVEDMEIEDPKTGERVRTVWLNC